MTEWKLKANGNAHYIFQSEDSSQIIRLSKNTTSHSPLSDPEMSPFALYLPPAEQVTLPKELLQLVQTQYSFLNTQTALQMPDLSQYEWSIELKPKWSFITPEYQPVCRYCRHQQIKGTRSDFCPIDLYSLQPERMEKAIEALFSQPMNNLLLYSQSKKYGPFEFLQLFQQQLRLGKNEVFTLISKCLRESQILELIQKYQILWHKDVEYIYSLYQKHQNNSMLYDSTYYTNILLSKSNQELEVEEIMKYMLSCVMKDVSIFLCFSRKREDSRWQLATNELWYRVYLIDLDLKPMKKIEKHLTLHRELLKVELDKNCYQ